MSASGWLEESLLRFFTYTLVNDSGFAPNPFHGFCTLACCKPQIRKTAQPGDWIIGLTPKRLGSRLAYAMLVSEKLTFAAYFNDLRFRAKQPRWQKGVPTAERCGDNCYRPLGDGDLELLPSTHFPNDDDAGRQRAARNRVRDLSCREVLVARRFSYFGGEALSLDPKFGFAVAGRGHRVNFSPAQVAALGELVESLPPRIHGRPRRWADGDESWREVSRCA